MSQLASSPSIESILPAEVSCWLVLDRHSQTLQRIYQLEPSPQLAWLFHRTRYAQLADQSPLVVKVDPGSLLLQTYMQQADPALSNGILIASHAAEPRVLDHLRQRVEILFYGSRKGLFRFYDPWIASAFFSVEGDHEPWLGLLERIIWCGGTLHQQAKNGVCWYACISSKGTRCDDILPPGTPKLSHLQEKALESFMLLYPVWDKWTKEQRTGDSLSEQLSQFLLAADKAMKLAIPPLHLEIVIRLFTKQSPGEWLVGVEDVPPERRLDEIKKRFAIQLQSADKGAVA